MSNAGGVGKKRDSGRIYGFVAYRSTVLSTVRIANCKKQSCDERRQASSRAFPAASVVRTRRRRSVCDGLDVIRRRRREVNPPDTTPLVITLVFCCRTTSWDRTRRVFLLKTDTNPYFWPYPIHEEPDPTDPRTAANKGGLWPTGVCPGVLVGHRRRQ